MIKSMTGYGKTSCEFNNKTITVEIRSLNSKQTDVYLKLPNIYKEKDVDIRNLLVTSLKRGKIECTVTIDSNGAEQAAVINKEVVKAYFNQLTELRQELDTKVEEPLLQVIFRFPETIKTDKEGLDDAEWQQLKSCVQKAIEQAESYRAQEGGSLEKDISERLKTIEKHLESIVDFENVRIEKIKDRIKNSLTEFFSEEDMDKNRFEQELIYYLEKIDITEEKVRLKNHCNYFREVINDEDQAGKKLGFISQELGREINTIGSKANDFEIQKRVVLMKDELEKIKEQLMNIL
jgi:uncharacterized protein (TIGR00255 family)